MVMPHLDPSVRSLVQAIVMLAYIRPHTFNTGATYRYDQASYLLATVDSIVYIMSMQLSDWA